MDRLHLVLFSEVQIQSDPKLYERLFSKIAIYTYCNTDSFADWSTLVIYSHPAITQAQRIIQRAEQSPDRSA